MSTRSRAPKLAGAVHAAPRLAGDSVLHTLSMCVHAHTQVLYRPSAQHAKTKLPRCQPSLMYLPPLYWIRLVVHSASYKQCVPLFSGSFPYTLSGGRRVVGTTQQTMYHTCPKACTVCSHTSVTPSPYCDSMPHNATCSSRATHTYHSKHTSRTYCQSALAS